MLGLNVKSNEVHAILSRQPSILFWVGENVANKYIPMNNAKKQAILASRTPPNAMIMPKHFNFAMPTKRNLFSKKRMKI